KAHIYSSFPGRFSAISRSYEQSDFCLYSSHPFRTELFCIFYHLMDDIDRNNEFCNRHCKPDRISAEYCRKQIDQNTAAVPRAYFSVSRILPPFPAPKLVEIIGCDACPTLYAQHCTKVLMLTIIP